MLGKFFQRLNVPLFNKTEPWFFYLLVAAHLILLLKPSLFFTLDGPAHLYNARIIQQLVLQPDTNLHNYYSFSPGIIPNWTGHLLLSILSLILPALWAEKIVQVFCIIALPLLLRYWMYQLPAHKNSTLLYFVFPFTYSYLFFLGFYNFILGVIFMIYTLLRWHKFLLGNFTVSAMIQLGILCVLVYLSHLFVFGFLLLAILIMNLHRIIDSEAPFAKRPDFSVILLKQLAVIFPSMVLLLVYLSSSSLMAAGGQVFVEQADLWKMIRQVQPAKGVEFGKEDVFTKWIFYLLMVHIIYHFVKWLRRPNFKLSALTITALVLAIAAIAAMFVLPDSNYLAGFVSSRLLLMFYLFLILFLFGLQVPLLLRATSFMLIVYVNIALLHIYYQHHEKHAELGKSLIEISKRVQPGSIVLPLNDNENPMFGHVSNYLGLNDGVIILENYEANQHYFPVRWKTQFPEKVEYEGIMGSSLPAEKLNSGIDYVFILRQPYQQLAGSREEQIIEVLRSDFKINYENKTAGVILYERNRTLP